jgi:ketosteroid isomerase-like protein
VSDDLDRVTDDFARRLQEFERTRDVDPLVELFSDDAELSKLDGADVRHGRDGARRFWTEYREVFDDLRSEFTGDTRGGDRAVLEWVAEGSLRPAGDGGARSVRYPGVSILEVADGAIRRFRTVYDSGPFLAPRAATA